jgi:hypothetical protein
MTSGATTMSKSCIDFEEGLKNIRKQKCVKII